MASTSSSSAPPSRPASIASTRPASSASLQRPKRRGPSSSTNLILGVAIVDFNHLQGPIVEWSHPESLSNSSLHPDLTSSLPFCALPDGSHLSDEDYAHFHLHCPSISRHSTVFGISCNRQIASEKLLVKGKDVTRSTVQKAVVVLARQPIFAPLREKLGIVTRAYFTQGDLADTTILVDFHETLEVGLRAAGLKGEDVAEDDDFADDDEVIDGEDPEEAAQRARNDQAAANEDETEDADRTATKEDLPPIVLPSTTTSNDQSKKDELREGVMYMGTSLRELIFKFRFKTLMLVKLLLLQKRIMFFGYPVEKLCVYEYTLVSLIPGLLLSLSDCSSPELAYAKRKELTIPETVKTSDRKSLLRFCGCPLRLFGEDAFFQPYMPLQQIDLLRAPTWLVGTTNLIFKQQKEFKPDVVVDLENSTLDFPTSAGPLPTNLSTPQHPHQQNPTLHSVVSLTAADRKWMDELVHVVVESYNPADPSRPTTSKYEGSEDWIRARFEHYICSMLSCVKYSDSLGPTVGASGTPRTSSSGTSTPIRMSATASTISTEAGDAEVIASYGSAFISTFKTTKAYEIWSKSTSSLLYDLVPYRHPCAGKISTLEDVSLRLTAGIHDLKLEEQMATGREALGNAGRNLYSMANTFGMEVAKRRREWAAQQQQQAAAGEGADGDSTSASKEDGTATPSSYSIPREIPASLAPHAQAAQQAALRASTEARAALGRFGNYLGSRGWGSSAAPKPTAASTADSETKAGAVDGVAKEGYPPS